MRHHLAAFCLALCLLAPVLAPAPAPAAASGAQPGDKAAPNAPSDAAVREYIELFGYREMLELGARQQLEAVVELVRQTNAEVQPGVLEQLREALEGDLRAESERAVAEMVPVFQRHLSRQDVDYLIGVGRDPRMRRIVAVQPQIATDLEGIGERLNEALTARAGERIRERLRQLRQGREL